MFAPESDVIVDSLIEAEYKSAVNQYGKTYQDENEAHEVLFEEIIESINEVKKLTPNVSTECAAVNIKNARAAIKELAQVCAVCGKILAGAGCDNC